MIVKDIAAGTWVYITKCDERNFERIIRMSRKILPAAAIDRANRFAHTIDACLYLTGRCLLFNGIAELTCAMADMAKMRISPFGKPYIEGLPAFNISHSGNMVACAITGRGSVGIDIEMVRDIDISGLSRVFTKNEWNEISGSGSDPGPFYKYWTRKEAILKADGRGLSLGMSELETTGDTVELNGKQWFLEKLPLPEEYHAHISTEEKSCPLHVVFCDPWLKKNQAI